MIISIIIAFFSLVGLLFFHEFGHFIVAKKFKVRVEEFGFGYPPRLFGKRVGETMYSINLLPFGAFVRVYGEEEQRKDPGSFFGKPVWQRALIMLAGIFSFWLISLLLFSLLMGFGVPTAVEDEADGGLINPKVQIIEVAVGSPALTAGLKAGDALIALKVKNDDLPEVNVSKVKEVQEFTEQHKGEEIVLTLQRGKDVFDLGLIPRVSPPEGQGPLGVALVRTALKSYPWYLAGFKGFEATGQLTVLIIQGWASALRNLILGKPTSAQLVGPVGIFGMFMQASEMGTAYFLNFIGLISLYLALLNLLPIPALDGGKLLFLAIEKIRGRPVKEKIEKAVTSIFFALLITLMVWATIKDIARIF